ncbi:hypothetical protein C8T65DRAFT_745372 [Cerioporus squamosus]|nr:hypothetical protein C8T65DRAFT_745372 [Cerioporus squamosus]
MTTASGPPSSAASTTATDTITENDCAPSVIPQKQEHDHDGEEHDNDVMFSIGPNNAMGITQNREIWMAQGEPAELRSNLELNDPLWSSEYVFPGKPALSVEGHPHSKWYLWFRTANQGDLIDAAVTDTLYKGESRPMPFDIPDWVVEDMGDDAEEKEMRAALPHEGLDVDVNRLRPVLAPAPKAALTGAAPVPIPVIDPITIPALHIIPVNTDLSQSWLTRFEWPMGMHTRNNAIPLDTTTHSIPNAADVDEPRRTGRVNVVAESFISMILPVIPDGEEERFGELAFFRRLIELLSIEEALPWIMLVGHYERLLLEEPVLFPFDCRKLCYDHIAAWITSHAATSYDALPPALYIYARHTCSCLEGLPIGVTMFRTIPHNIGDIRHKS